MRSAPKLIARLIGVFYVLLCIGGVDLFYVFGRIVIRNDAAATAANIQAHGALFLARFATGALGVAAYLVVTALFYRLFEPASRTLSLSAALFSLTGCIVQGAGLVLHLVPVIVLGHRPWLDVFTLAQRQALAQLSLSSYLMAYDVSMVFFAFYLFQLGCLVLRSTFLPRWIGPFVMLGVGWLAFLYQPLARSLSSILVLSSVGELMLVLWLLVKGVDEHRWHEQAAAAGLEPAAG